MDELNNLNTNTESVTSTPAVGPTPANDIPAVEPVTEVKPEVVSISEPAEPEVVSVPETVSTSATAVATPVMATASASPSFDTPSNLTAQYMQSQSNSNSVGSDTVVADKPELDDTPVSMWAYVGYEILFAIPCVGLIVFLVLAFGNKNINVKNYAKGKLMVLLIGIVLSIILTVFAGMAISSIISSLLGN